MKRFRLTFLILALLLTVQLITAPGFAVETVPSLTSYDDAPVLQTSGFDPLEAKYALLVDANTGTILYDLNANELAYPASCTKIMTCLLVLEAIEDGALSLDQMITAGSSYWDGLTDDCSTQDITEGETMSVHDLLYCLMLVSANEAANILAVAVSGSISAFVDEMNARAEQLGCTGTHFCNPHGLHNENHYTTAWDLYTITLAAWQYPTFRELVGTAQYQVLPTNCHEDRKLYNTNLLLPERNMTDYSYEYAVGGKTGTTNAAGRCLVSIAEKDGRTLIAVVLGTENVKLEDDTVIRTVFKESKRLLEHGFDDYHTIALAAVGTAMIELPVTGGIWQKVGLSPTENISLLLPTDTDVSSFTYDYQLPDSLEAPISAGTPVGSVTITDATHSYSLELVAHEDVPVSPQPEETATLTQSPSGGTHVDLNRIIPTAILVIAVVLLLLIVALLSHNRRKQRRRSGRRLKK